MSLNIRIAIFLLFTPLMLSLISPITALAQDTAKRPSMKKDCQAVETKMDNRILFWRTAKENRVNKWSNLRSRLTKLAEKLKSKGYDVTKLQNDATTMSGYIDMISKDYDDIITKTSEVKKAACGDKTVLKSILSDLKALRAKAETDRNTVFDFIKNTVRPDILSYKGMKPSQAR